VTQLDHWKASLLDPCDPLLDLGAAGGLPVAGDPIRLAFVLGAGGGLELDAPAERIAPLRRAARDASDCALWLGLGLMVWDRARIAPIVMWPVELAPDGRIVTARGLAPRLNDLLAHELRERFDATLAFDSDLTAVLRAAGAIADAQPDWRIERSARLVTASFARFDAWRDIRDIDVTTSLPLAWLSGAAQAPALPAPITDVTAPLDADASQLAAIAAAGAGGSFVLEGAPGTGKSQTIANVVVHATAAGKTVLVVSDRLAALDSVHSRLTALGLAEFCLALHGEQADPARALDVMGKALDRAFRPGAGPSGDSTRLSELRTALDTHRAALHAPTPFGMTAYDVLARLVELRTTPCAALAEHDAAALERTRFAQRLTAVSALADAASAVEPVAMHPWRAAAFESWNVAGVARARTALEDTREAADELAGALADVSALVPRLVARTPEQLKALGQLAELAAASPRPGAELLTSTRSSRDDIGERVALIRARGGGAIDTPREPGEFTAIAARHRVLADELDETFTDAVTAIDAGALWAQLKRWTQSMAPLRYMALRAVRAEVRAAALPCRLETDEAMLVALEAAIAERACRVALESAAEPARRWFGELGKGLPLGLDLNAIDSAGAWATELRRAFDRIAVGGGEAGKQAAWRALVAQVSAAPDTTAELAPFSRLAAAVTRWDATLVELAAATGLPAAQLGAGIDHLSELRGQLAALHAAVDSIADWACFDLARRAAVVAGIGPAIAAIERGDLHADDLADAWERATLLAWLSAELYSVPALAKFDGTTQHSRVAAFVDVDRGALAMARTRAVARLSERVPRISRLPGPDEDPELAALRRARGESPPPALRALLSAIPTLAGKLAPCVLATPQAVAQHLDRALPAFDLVVFDEASRLPVALALGALARARAAIIVGDSRQLAPADGDGLLAVAHAAKLPALALSTHYRSRHEDLFAFANRRYYGERLELRPAPNGTDLGVSWRRVAGFVEANLSNRAEAEAIVAEAVARAGRSLAIVAMSRAQRELIEDLLPPGSDVLVGTPDRMQGEERDDILVSLTGTPGMLALPDAWLAVATTRARERMTIFASFDPEDVPADSPVAELVAFARAGGGASRAAENGEPASAITAAIARALAERGWILRHRVGCGAYRIPLAVVDPNDPTRYVLAIEDDGPVYATASSARERDRLRAQELVRLGWRLHRIWSLDWWHDAEREIARAHGAITAAVAAGRHKTQPPIAPRERRIARGSAPVAMSSAAARGSATTGGPATTRGSAPTAAPAREKLALPLPAPADDTAPMALGSGPNDAPGELDSGWTQPTRLPRGAIVVAPYIAAAIPAGRRVPDDMFAPRHLDELGKVVEQVLAAEAPMHVDLLARRVGAYFGVGRVTEKVVDQVRVALAGRGRWGDELGVVWRLDQDPMSVPPVRVMSSNAAGRRDIGEVPLVEVAAAARIVVERGHDVPAADLLRDCARLLGFARITDRVTARVALGVRLAASRELIALADGRARMPA
jgi:hypothetical protein